MHTTILLILAVVIVFLGAMIVMKIRELSSYKGDEEEERASAMRARLPKELQNLKLEEPNVENWDSPPTTEKKVGGDGTLEKKPQ